MFLIKNVDDFNPQILARTLNEQANTEVQESVTPIPIGQFVEPTLLVTQPGGNKGS